MISIDEAVIEDNPRAAANNSDEDDESEAVDYRFLSALTQKKDYAIPSRGEKDFEPDGTNKQDKILQASRDAMYEALSVERNLSGKNYIPAIWDSITKMGRVCTQDTRGTMFKSIGRTDSHGTTWLLPEELLYMVDRGSLECSYDSVHVAMSLQAAYAELIPHIGLDHFQIYAYLKRAGYMVLRAKQAANPDAEQINRSWLLSYRLSSTLARLKNALQESFSPVKGTISRRTLYRTYRDIYDRLSFIPCHLESDESVKKRHEVRGNPLTLSFDVWKPNTNFKKSAPGVPHFRIAVLDSSSHNVCSIDMIRELFDSLEVDSSHTSKSQFTRLKIGRKNFVLAIADMGVVSFLSLGDVSFGSESVYTEYKPMVDRPRRERMSEKQ